MTQSDEKYCKCKGQISKCNHSLHGLVTGFGDVRELFTGKIVYKHSDPSWQCAGCGVPIVSVDQKKDKLSP